MLPLIDELYSSVATKGVCVYRVISAFYVSPDLTGRAGGLLCQHEQIRCVIGWGGGAMDDEQLMDDDMDEVYVCMVCGHEDHPDKFGQFCPECGTDLDELEAS